MDTDTSSIPSSSQPASPFNDTRMTRSSTTLSRNLDPDPEKIASLAQKLHDSLKALKTSKNKTSVTIPVQELENIISRAQQVAHLCTASLRSREDALSLQISGMSNRLSSQIQGLESQFSKSLQRVPSGEPALASSAAAPVVLAGTHHPSLYLADGNLVMAADGVHGGKVLFRVHQSMLSLQSPVFAAMFTLPVTANRDMHDGVPFVHMHDDAEDIESLLKALYHPSYACLFLSLPFFHPHNRSELPHKRHDPLTPLNVSRSLAMATKYEMDVLRDRIVTQMEADWPQSLAEWDRLEMEIAALRKEHSESDGLRVNGLYLDERLPEPSAAIRLARKWNIPKILPSAFYHLSRIPSNADWLEDRFKKTVSLHRTARWDLLEADDFRLLLRLREAIAACEWDEFAPSKSCHSPEACEEWWHQTHLRWDHAEDQLESMRLFVTMRPAKLCKVCWNVVKYDVRDRRSEVWDVVCNCIEKWTRK